MSPVQERPDAPLWSSLVQRQTERFSGPPPVAELRRRLGQERESLELVPRDPVRASEVPSLAIARSTRPARRSARVRRWMSDGCSGIVSRSRSVPVEITRGKVPADIGRTDLDLDLGREPSVRFAGLRSRHDGVGVLEPTLSHEEGCPLELRGGRPRQPRTMPGRSWRASFTCRSAWSSSSRSVVDRTERKVSIDDRRFVFDSDSGGYVERMRRQLLPVDQPPLGCRGHGHDAGYGHGRDPVWSVTQRLDCGPGGIVVTEPVVRGGRP